MPDPVDPERPEDEGLAEPELPEVDIEGARLLANEARARLRGDGFDDDAIDAWVRVYFEKDHEGSVDGLIAFIEAEQAAGRGPTAP
ncbi:MAG TPA: hypothetical protein VIY72_11255 [Acidimicrobiales bacterium]